MVNNKKTKREKDIKSKLLAAVAMLLVSSIMMVSTTYAWFTLSTAPEVTGITTTIGSNGNLEIALSPRSGLGAEVGDANLTTGNEWTVKNLTWGNLVDLSDTSYGLADLTLSPAQLVVAPLADGGYRLGESAVLATPSYGSDGRISQLIANANIAGKAIGATGYASAGDYGVRAVGTASGMSAQEAKFRNSVNAITTYANAAITAASNSLAANGNALAGMLVQHAEAGESDANNYAQHVPALVTLTTELAAAVGNIDEALGAALIASVCSIEDETLFNTVVSNLEAAATLDDMVAILSDNGVTLPSQFNAIVDQRDALATKIANAKTAADALMAEADADGDGEVDYTTDADLNKVYTANITWTKAGNVLSALMNTSGDIKISGYTIADIKSKMNDMDFLLGLATDCQIQLGSGSGVYYDMAVITGNIAAKTTATVTARGMTVTLKNVIIKTTVAANTSALPLMKTAINAAVTPAGSTGGSVMDAFYGYVIDLMVRTNAEESSLKLQTAPAQRVYSDSSNEATMGKGTTITFTTQKQSNVAILDNLIRSVLVVFFDPSHSDTVFGLAKVTSVVITEEKIGTTEVEVKDDEGNVTGTQTVDVIEYTVTGTLELCEIKAAEVEGMYIAGEKLEDQTLCALSQNIPQAISALVYLDGENVTSADVLADANVVGALNLQFASTAELKPMENSELRNGTGNQTPATSESTGE